MSYLIIAVIAIFIGCTGRHSEQVAHTDGIAGQDSLRPVRVSDSLQLRYVPAVSTSLRCVAVQEDTLDSDSLHVRVRTELFFTEVIERVSPDGLIELGFRYDSIRVEQRYWEHDSLRQRTVRYRSTDPASRTDPRFEMLTAAIGEYVRAIITPTGTIEEISGVTGIVRKLLGQKADSLDVQQRRIVDEQLKAELYGQVLAQQFLILPETALDSTMGWVRVVEQPIPPLFTATATARYRLNGVISRSADSLYAIEATLSGTIRLLPEAKKTGIRIRTGLVRGWASGMLSARYGLMLQRQNAIEYDLVAEATGSDGKLQRVYQRKKTGFSLKVQAVTFPSHLQ